MITSKYIRTLCKILVYISYGFTVILMFIGFVGMISGKLLEGTLTILIGVILSLVVNISLYPIFALSLIESSTEETNENLEVIIDLLLEIKNDSGNVSQTVEKAILPQRISDLDTLDYINKEFNIHINPTDDLYTIKEKIAEIVDSEYFILKFKQSVAKAESILKVEDIFNNYRAITDYNAGE